MEYTREEILKAAREVRTTVCEVIMGRSHLEPPQIESREFSLQEAKANIQSWLNDCNDVEQIARVLSLTLEQPTFTFVENSERYLSGIQL